MKSCSFIIPVYNCGGCLEGCIAGIQAMQLEQYEIILIDDGSGDDSGVICDRLAERFDEIRVFHQENQGVSSARNRGIEMAEGELIVFLDADDTMEPEKLRRLIHTMEDDDALDLLIYGISFDYYHHGKCYRRDELAYPETGQMPLEKWTKELLQMYQHNALSSSCTKIFRKSIITSNQLRFNQKMFLYEDLEFVLRYLACCKTIYNSEEIAYLYHQQEDEGNAGRRLLRIDHLPDLISQVEAALWDLIVNLNLDANAEHTANAILTQLYLTLAQQKIAVADRRQIAQICQEMSDWMKDRPDAALDSLSDESRDYLEAVMNERINWLLENRRYTAIRHKIAVFVKNMPLYQRLKQSR
ncbi:MAG: glycosyltransferase [Lachnospiraceae bacterium]|nr:glycosyltransferase [Lachnospiraceae bacterium]